MNGRFLHAFTFFLVGMMMCSRFADGEYKTDIRMVDDGALRRGRRLPAAQRRRSLRAGFQQLLTRWYAG
jgi:hypothetical protein